MSKVVLDRTFHTFNLINYVKMKSFQLFLLMREEAMQQGDERRNEHRGNDETHIFKVTLTKKSPFCFMCRFFSIINDLVP